MLAVTAVLAVAQISCADPPTRAADGDAGSDDWGSAPSRPAVEAPSRAPAPAESPTPFLDPDADPRTRLGRLRARHLPHWTPELDGAFPPEVCDSAWELDGIASSEPGADLAVLGDFAAAAALSVMRYEYQLSRALADPSPLAQLCVAVASVGPARSTGLEALGEYLAAGVSGAGPPTYPDEVVLVAAGPAKVLAVACVTPDEGAESRLQAYLLTVTQGLEDEVRDVSYRVSDTAAEPAPDCTALPAWSDVWHAHVQRWMAEGQIWTPLNVVVAADGLCASPPPDGPDECPRDWPR